MWTLVAVKMEVVSQSLGQLRYALITLQVNVFVFDRPPQSLDEYVVQRGTSPTHLQLIGKQESFSASALFAGQQGLSGETLPSSKHLLTQSTPVPRTCSPPCIRHCRGVGEIQLVQLAVCRWWPAHFHWSSSERARAKVAELTMRRDQRVSGPCVTRPSPLVRTAIQLVG